VTAIDSFEASKENYKSATAQEIASWIGRGACATPSVFPSPGIGQDVRLEGQDIFGAGLLVEDQPVHVELFGSVRGAQFKPTSRPVRVPDREQDATGTDAPVAGEAVWGAKWLNRIFRRKPAA
jgi:hypothetical protein